MHVHAVGPILGTLAFRVNRVHLGPQTAKGLQHFQGPKAGAGPGQKSVQRIRLELGCARAYVVHRDSAGCHGLALAGSTLGSTLPVLY